MGASVVRQDPTSCPVIDALRRYTDDPARAWSCTRSDSLTAAPVRNALLACQVLSLAFEARWPSFQVFSCDYSTLLGDLVTRQRFNISSSAILPRSLLHKARGRGVGRAKVAPRLSARCGPSATRFALFSVCAANRNIVRVPFRRESRPSAPLAVHPHLRRHIETRRLDERAVARTVRTQRAPLLRFPNRCIAAQSLRHGISAAICSLKTFSLTARPWTSARWRCAASIAATLLRSCRPLCAARTAPRRIHDPRTPRRRPRYRRSDRATMKELGCTHERGTSALEPLTAPISAASGDPTAHDFAAPRAADSRTLASRSGSILERAGRSGFDEFGTRDRPCAAAGHCSS